MKWTKLSSLLVAGVCAATIPTGCATSGRGYVVASYYEEAPPAPREEYAVYRPGFIWVHGSWTRYDEGWRWRDGYYARERPGYVYQQGRWDRRGRGYVWVNGTWQAQGGVVVRDHRHW